MVRRSIRAENLAPIRRASAHGVILHEHESAVCRHCGSPLYYGLKEEPSGWKSTVVCDPDDGCGREWAHGWIPRTEVDHIDDAYERAKREAAGADR